VFQYAPIFAIFAFYFTFVFTFFRFTFDGLITYSLYTSFISFRTLFVILITQRSPVSFYSSYSCLSL
jgi:hypothetical protein